MPNLADELQVEQIDEHRYRTSLSEGWAMWGPFGGYLASLALACVGRETRLPRPASLHCQYLAVGRFDQVDILVRPLREGRRAAAYGISMEQNDRTILTAAAWCTAPSEGVVHDTAIAPEVPGHEDVPDPSAEDRDPFPFAQNFRTRTVLHDIPCPPIWRAWVRFGDASFEDPWLDAARSLILLDLSGWPSAIVHHQGPLTPYLAQSLDLYATFHRGAPASPWLLIDGHTPISQDGLLGWNSRVWTQSGELVATGSGQGVWRPL